MSLAAGTPVAPGAGVTLVTAGGMRSAVAPVVKFTVTGASAFPAKSRVVERDRDQGERSRRRERPGDTGPRTLPDRLDAGPGRLEAVEDPRAELRARSHRRRADRESGGDRTQAGDDLLADRAALGQMRLEDALILPVQGIQGRQSGQVLEGRDRVAFDELVDVRGGILEAECGTLLKDFFAKR